MENDNAKTIKDQWKVDPLEGVTLNDVQQTIVDEALGNAESMRTEKQVSMELENKYSGSFGECDSMIKGLDTESLKKLLRNVYINENPKWHSERNSLVHIKIVMSRGLQTKDTDLSKAALYHDIAKFDTVSFNKAGWPTSLGHDKAGAEVAKADGCDDMVVYICAKHMVIKGWLASATGGPSEGGELNPNTKFKIFAEAPGADNNEKAKAFWKLCVFSKMDNMGNDFNAESLKWDNPSYDKWDEECPLRDQFKKSELVEIKAEKAPVLFTAQEIMKFGAKGPQIGQINKEISGKTKEEAFEIIKKILGNPDLTMESKKWIKTFESFRMSRINENTAEGKEMTLNIFAPVSVVVDIEDGVVTNFSGDEIEREGINSFGEKDFQEAFEPFEKAGVKVSYTPWRSEGGDDYEGSYSIDVPSLNDAIKNKKITIIVDPEDPEEYLEIKNK
jgi:hypothetical protein